MSKIITLNGGRSMTRMGDFVTQKELLESVGPCASVITELVERLAVVEAKLGIVREETPNHADSDIPTVVQSSESGDID